MNVDDHMHSDNVLFYNLGLGSKNNVTEKEWNIMTLSAILSKLGHTEVGYAEFFPVCFSVFQNAITLIKLIILFIEYNRLPQI